MPRLGLGSIDLSNVGGTGQDVVTAIDDFFFESNASGEVNPILTTSRTNLIPYSNEFTNSSGTGWILSATYALEANSIISPDGTQNATKVTLPSGNGALRTQTISVSPNTRYVFSFFAKRGTASEMKYRVFDFTDPYADIVGKTSYYSQTNTDTWVRIEVPFTTAATTNVISVYIDSDGQGDGYFYAYGAQLEQDGFASAYIPTSGSAVTVSTTLNDTSEVWDFDSTDIMLEADPEDEGFWEEGSNLVLNHDYEELGSEKVNYPSDVSSITDPWILDSSTNKYKYVDSGSGTGRINFGTPFAVEVGQIYKVEVDITISSGNANMAFKSGNSQTSLFNNRDFSNGLNTFFTTVSGVNGSIARIFVNGNNTDNDFTLNSISVKQVDPNDRWVLADGTTISDGKANLDGSSAFSTPLKQNGVMTVGDTYEATYTISNYSGSGSVKVFSNTTTNPARNANGTYTDIFVASGTSFDFQNGSTAITCSIDNVTVREYAITPLDV